MIGQQLCPQTQEFYNESSMGVSEHNNMVQFMITQMKTKCCGSSMGVSEHNNVVQFMITQIL